MVIRCSPRHPQQRTGRCCTLAHVPFQVLLSPDPVNPRSPARPNLSPDEPYYLPPTAATQLCTALFHLLGVGALFVAGRRISNTHVALGLVCVYCCSLAVLGIGGREEQVAGITFVSHIAPASTTLLAFAALPRPALSGVLLAVSTGVGFYPAFMVPAWLGFYWNDRLHRARFLVGYLVAAAIIAAGVYAHVSSRRRAHLDWAPSCTTPSDITRTRPATARARLGSGVSAKDSGAC